MNRRFAPRILYVLLILSFALVAVPPAAAAPDAPLATTVFSESMYDGTGGVTGTQTIAYFESGNYFQNDALTMTGTGDMRTTTASTGYTGASGSYNVFLTNTAGRYFQIADINTASYTNLVLSFGVYKSTTAENGSSLTVAVSSDGTSWTNLTVPALPTGTGTAAWYYRTASGTIPATSTLYIKFTNTSATPQFRIDDVLLVGDLAGDTAPTVTSTTPATGATNVTTNTTVTINFSEAVNLTASAVTLECPAGTPKTFTGLPANGVTSVVLTPDAALPSGTTCTVTVVANQVSDLDGVDPLNMAANYVFTFTTDAAPSVTSTTPLNGATGVAVGANLSVTFSEAVNVSNIDSFFDIYCEVSGVPTLQPAAGSGGPTTFTINPTADLPAGSSCTVTIHAADVTDQDANDPPDNMAANYVFTFATAAVDAAPYVSSTVPTNGATGVAAGADLSVTFSEPVNVSNIDSFFDIYCEVSGVPTLQPAAGSGGPTTFTINPTNDLPGGSSCTVTIKAAQVTDQDANDPPDNMAADYSWNFTVAVPVIPCERLFFSEYIEGSSNNKALEIYNGSAAAVDLSNYTVELYANGASTPTNTANLSGSLAAGDVYVIANDAANATILSVADLLSTVTYYNGDDALALKYNGALVDVIGQIGFDPGTEWGSGLTTTLNHTLRRKVTISAGDANGSDAFDPALEWDGYAIDTIGGLGSHAATACYVPPDVPPTVSSTAPGNAETDVAVAANINIFFSEPVTVSGAWYSISCASSGGHTAVASGGPSAWILNPDTNFSLGELCTVTIVAAQVADQDGTPNNMAADYVFSFTTVAADPCSQPATLISAIQGSGASSLVVGQSKTIQGIVVGDYETGTSPLKGYFVEEETTDWDGSSATSEGIFIYDANTTSQVNLGDKVRVTGTVAESSELTELKTITALTICASGQDGLVTAAQVTLPVAALTDLEPFEGMKVTFPQVLTVTDNYDLGYSGQLTLSANGKLWQYTHLNPPSVSGYNAYLNSIALRSIVLDDWNTNLDPDPIYYPGTGLTALNTVRVDDTVTNLTMVLDQSTTYRLQPIGQVNFTPSNPRPVTAPAVGGNIKVGAFNTLNFFVTTGAGYTCGPYSTLQCRGASNATEYTRQLNKLVAAICGLNADVLGLMELENPDLTETTDPVLGALVAALNASPACVDDYAFIDNAWAGTDAIRQGLIYKPTVVTPVGTTAFLVSTAFINGGDSSARNRPALTQAFEALNGGERFIVSVNHLKSKGSACTAPDLNDGQGNCAVVRTNAANVLTAWLATNPTGTGDPDILIMGDLNSYAKEDPITAFVNAGYTDLINWTVGSAGYSYAFDGMMGYLDHALASPALLAQTLAANEWHINSDEPDVLDYNTEYKSAGQVTSLYNADPYRSTDHDPVLVGLGLYPDQGDLAPSYGSAWHTGQGVLRLGSLWTGDATSTPGGDNLSDDGVTFSATANWGGGAGAIVTAASGAGCLNGWMDFTNGIGVGSTYADGDFGDSYLGVSEHLIVNAPVPAGAYEISFPVPPGLVGATSSSYAFRFRLSPAPCTTSIQPTGRVDGGEVEDYQFTFSPLAVDLASFTAQAAAEGVTLAWETVSETDNAGFNVYRADSEAGPWVKLNEALIASAAPGSSEGHSYAWTDGTAAQGATYWYALEDVALDGTATQHEPIAVTVAQPNAVGLAAFAAAPLAGSAPALAGLAALMLGAVAGATKRKRR